MAAVAVYVVFDLVTAPHVEAVVPAAGSASSNASPTVAIDLPGAAKLDKLSVRFDGKDVTRLVRVAGERLFFEPGALDDGEHVVVLHADTPSLLRPNLSKSWRFTIDTVDPTVTVMRPRAAAAVTSLPVTLRGTTEPGATVVVKVDLATRGWKGAAAIAAAHKVVDRLEVSPTPRVTIRPSPDPASATPMAGGEGAVVASPVPSAVDETGATATSAGDAATASAAPNGEQSATPPGSASAAPEGPSSPTPTVIESPTTDARLTAGADGRFATRLTLPDGPATIRVTATDGAGNTFTRSTDFIVDVNPPELIVGGIGKLTRNARPRITIVAADQASAPRVRVRLDDEIVYEKSLNGTHTLPRDVLAEGRHTLLVTATDPGGSVVTDDRSFLVNSTEKLGKATLIAGAKGADVRDLQRLMQAQGFFSGQKTGVYDKRTLKAVVRLQESLGMAPDGVVGPMVLAALRGRLIVDQSECRLYFYVDGKLKKSYSVAVGQPQYPTPNGTFHVVSMIENPTWVPPDSPWAKGLEPIPPGPDNPVGTRWIGTSAPNVGIHGTPSDSSIGSHASHGCIRMHMWDVEELFQWVTVGMPVIIRP